MSLMAMKELADAVENLPAEFRLGARTAAARAEMAALENAAKTLDDDEVRQAVRHAPEDVHEAMALLATIAKESE